MPELPDVEYYRAYLDATSLHQRIDAIEVRAPRILEGVTEEGLRSALAGHSFQSTRRHGKYVFVEIDAGAGEGGWLVMHFGMTGRLAYFGDSEDDPKHDRLRIGFANGSFLAFVNQRKFGHIALAPSPGSFAEDKQLGPDALGISREAFVERFSGRRGRVKTAFMNQKVLAGIGNIYADEILFGAGVHPKTPVQALDDDALGRLYDVMGVVLRAAIAARVRHKAIPPSFLLPHRRDGGVCPLDGTPLETLKISGRTAYFCPTHQIYEGE
jgi:formamidopyrimidine-DNA glycosylase